MSSILTVSSPKDPRLDLYRDLRDVDLRQSLEMTHGVFMAEGFKIIVRALENGLTPLSFLVTPKWLGELEPFLSSVTAPCFVLPEKDIEQLTGFHVHRGALAVFARPEPIASASVLESASRVLVLEDLVDHSNIGAIFRSAAALNWDAILLSPRCADPWYRRAIKVSMGAVFSMPFAYVDDWYELPQLLAANNFQSIAMTLAADALSLDSITLDEESRLALIVGSEGHGITPHWQRHAHERVIIPMRANIDSLNVAASVAIACWELRKPSLEQKVLSRE